VALGFVVAVGAALDVVGGLTEGAAVLTTGGALAVVCGAVAVLGATTAVVAVAADPLSEVVALVVAEIVGVGAAAPGLTDADGAGVVADGALERLRT
jgi:hypothetical protein